MRQLLPLQLRIAISVLSMLLAGTAFPQAQNRNQQGEGSESAEIVLPDGRHVDFAGAFSSSRDVEDPQSACDPVINLLSGRRNAANQPKGERSKCDKAIDIVAGPPTFGPAIKMMNPRAITVDSKQRVIVTDPGAHALHFFDFERSKYFRIEAGWDTKLVRVAGADANPLRSPGDVAVDSRDNVYVTDIKRGMVLVYDSYGKFSRYIGNINGEGYYDRPNAIAIDRKTDRVYVADTPRHLVIMHDNAGKVLKTLGKRGGGGGPAEFRQPTDVVVSHDELIVADAKNSRIQILDLEGNFLRQFAISMSEIGKTAREVTLGRDSEGNIYVVNATPNSVQVYDRDGRLLATFGQAGHKRGQFQTPVGVWVDARDFIYIADSKNHRVQILRVKEKDTPADQR